MRGDLIDIFKILKLDRVDSERMIRMVRVSRIRHHSLRIRGKPLRTEVRRIFFYPESDECVESIPQNVAEAKMLSDFRKKLDIALGATGIKRYGGKGGSGY